jgi:hypothetical protein
MEPQYTLAGTEKTGNSITLGGIVAIVFNFSVG